MPLADLDVGDVHALRHQRSSPVADFALPRMLCTCSCMRGKRGIGIGQRSLLRIWA
jgi:hypothetical protein